MNKISRIKTIALILLCLPFCGGWTKATDNQSDRYVGGELIATFSEETISYVSKQVVEDITTTNGVPEYTPVGDLQNACGAVAGSTIVGFYDKYYDNLIPDWASCYSTGKYRIQDRVNVPALMQDLYTRMQTNVVAPGVSESEFKNGLKGYVNARGYNLQYISLGTGNNFNYSTFKTAVKNNEPTVLFVRPSTLYYYQTINDEDVITTSNISGNHIMVAYGYFEIKYTLRNGTRTDKYLYVATGLAGNLTALYKIGSYVVAAYQVKIN